jgi:septum formation protein
MNDDFKSESGKRRPRLILASSSLRRRELLREHGYEFEVIEPDPLAECGICSRETPPELVARLAFQKAADVAKRVSGPAIVIGCDTVAECMGQILGKPKNLEHAREMMKLLRGREHHVYSGLCLWFHPGDERHVEVDVTKLYMDPLPDERIEEYLASGGWEGKAGGFGFQDNLGWIRINEGSESNVVGLPMERLATMLSRFGD